MKQRFAFVRRNLEAWKDVASESGRDIPLADLAPRLRMGRSIWVVQAFHVLRERGYPVRLTDTLDEGAVNVLHVDDLRWRPDLWRYFLVTEKAAPGMSQYETVVFMGHAFNLAEELRSEGFRAELRELGMRLVVRDENWWDYGDADVVLAVRGGTDMYLAVKPASKLINAWMAGCPAILNPEIGYSELRSSELDYLEATDAGQVLEALRRLKEQPDLFRRMVDRGRERAREFETSRIADRWEEVIEREIVPRYRAWRGARPSRPLGVLRTVAARVRRRLWGTQAIQDPPSSAVRRWANAVRRALALPGAFLPGRAGARALSSGGSARAPASGR